jgi:transglutaminase-like putative cysteine protease
MTQIPGYYTRQEAAALLDLSTQRIGAIAQRDAWTGYWLYVREDVDRTAIKQDAQHAWAILRIPRSLWGAACPSCGWKRPKKPAR